MKASPMVAPLGAATSPKSRIAHLRLVRTPVNRDTVEILTVLLDGARSGEINGIAFAVSLGGNRFLTDVTGSCADSPTRALGMVSFLADEIRGVQHRMDPEGAR